MEICQSIVAGVIQGITEFIPVSSSAHLAILPIFMHWPDSGHAADVVVHFGSLGGIFLIFRTQIFSAIMGLLKLITNQQRDEDTQYTLSLIVASLPTIIIFGVAEIYFPFRLNSLLVVGTSAIGFGTLLMVADRFAVRKDCKESEISIKDAFIIGLFQVCSIIAGASRLGCCLTGMRFLGYGRSVSFKFSMMMSVIPVCGAVFLKTIKVLTAVDEISSDGLVLSCLMAFIFGVLTLRVMNSWVEKKTFFPFVIYRILLGCVLLILYYYN